MTHREEAPSLNSRRIAELASSIEGQLSICPEEDVIHDCGAAVLSVINNRPEAVKALAHEKLHALPYQKVPDCWTRLYEEACIWTVVKRLTTISEEQIHDDVPSPAPLKRTSDGKPKTSTVSSQTCSKTWLSEVVRDLDMAIILTRAPRRRDLIDHIFNRLEAMVSHDTVIQNLPELFPNKRNTIEVETTIPIKSSFSLVDFQRHLDAHGGPLILKGTVAEWPASETWRNPQYLCRQTLQGHRLVPIEIGRSYTDADWTQRIMTVREFLTSYLLDPAVKEVGYLAQHDLLDQVPALAQDTVTPDFCYADPPDGVPCNLAVQQPKLDEPSRNIWLGPGRTVSDLHTDPYHNILCQVVGRKYIRLYAPEETPKLYPRGIDEAGINMDNTSHVDISLARRLLGTHASQPQNGHSTSIDGLHDELKDFETRFPRFSGAKHVECILEAGDALYIPVGWWHYIESLEVSINVSYWFN